MAYVDYLRGIQTNSQYPTRIVEALNSLSSSGDLVLIGNLFEIDVEYARFSDHLILDPLVSLPFVDIALQKGNYATGLGNDLRSGPKFLITTRRGNFSGKEGDPFIFIGPTILGRYFIYYCLDAGEGPVIEFQTPGPIVMSLTDFRFGAINNPNVFEDVYFYYGSEILQGSYSMASTRQVVMSVPLAGFNLRQINLSYTIDGSPADVSTDVNFLKVSEAANVVESSARRTFDLAFTSGVEVNWETLIFPENTVKVDLSSSAWSMSGTFSQLLPELFQFPDALGYPVLKLSFNSDKDMEDIIPWVYGLQVSPFKDSDSSTFSMLCLQNGGRSFIRRFGTFDSFITPEEDGKWKANISHAPNLSTVFENLEVIINIDGQGNTFEGRAYFRNPQEVDVINDGTDLTGIIDSDEVLEKYEFRQALTDAEALELSGVIPRETPSLYFFSPSLMDLDDGCLYLNAFAEGNANKDISGGVTPFFGNDRGRYGTFYLEPNGAVIKTVGAVEVKEFGFCYNGRRDNFFTKAVLTPTHLDITCELGILELNLCNLYLSTGGVKTYVFNKDKITRTSTGFRLGLDEDLVNVEGLSIKGWLLYG